MFTTGKCSKIILYNKKMNLQEKAEVIRAIDYENVTHFEEPFVSYIAELWENAGIQEAYERRREYHLIDSAK